jgi:TPR repeat protein
MNQLLLTSQDSYLAAAMRGDIYAILYLAGQLMSGTYQIVDELEDTQMRHVKDPQMAFRLIENAAMKDYRARFILARCYWSGIGVARDSNKAESWLRRIPSPCNTTELENLEQLVFGHNSRELALTARNLHLIP